jgi:hypothetical protein
LEVEKPPELVSPKKQILNRINSEYKMDVDSPDVRESKSNKPLKVFKIYDKSTINVKRDRSFEKQSRKKLINNFIKQK